MTNNQKKKLRQLDKQKAWCQKEAQKDIDLFFSEVSSRVFEVKSFLMLQDIENSRLQFTISIGEKVVLLCLFPDIYWNGSKHNPRVALTLLTSQGIGKIHCERWWSMNFVQRVEWILKPI